MLKMIGNKYSQFEAFCFLLILAKNCVGCMLIKHYFKNCVGCMLIKHYFWLSCSFVHLHCDDKINDESVQFIRWLNKQLN